jgi:predicted nucleic acid-binding protein
LTVGDYFDSSAFVAAVSEDDTAHDAALAAWKSAVNPVMYAHGLLESYSTLTGKRHPACMAPDEATAVIAGNMERIGVEIIQFTPLEIINLLKKARGHGARGGAVYDYMHLCAARKAGAERIFTLNKRHFAAIAPDLAPKILHPSELF